MLSCGFSVNCPSELPSAPFSCVRELESCNHVLSITQEEANATVTFLQETVLMFMMSLLGSIQSKLSQ